MINFNHEIDFTYFSPNEEDNQNFDDYNLGRFEEGNQIPNFNDYPLIEFDQLNEDRALEIFEKISSPKLQDQDTVSNQNGVISSDSETRSNSNSASPSKTTTYEPSEEQLTIANINELDLNDLVAELLEFEPQDPLVKRKRIYKGNYAKR